MLHAIPLMLETDTVDYVDVARARLAEQRGRNVSRSDFIEFLARYHMIKQKKRLLDRSFEEKLEKRKLLKACA